MLVELFSAAALHQKITLIRLAVHASAVGLPSITILSCTPAASRESILKLRAMFRHGGFKLPAKKYTISITPAIPGSELKGIEAALAVGLLAAAERIAPPPHPFGVFGSVDLNGSIHQDGPAHEHVLALHSIPSITIAFNTSRAGAQWSAATSVHSLQTIPSLHHCDLAHLPRTSPLPLLPPPLQLPLLTLSDAELRIIQVLSAGKHTTLLYGPPGEGKTRVAELSASITDCFMEEELLQPHSLYKRSRNHQPPFLGTLLQPPYCSLGPESTPSTVRRTADCTAILILNELPLLSSATLLSLREVLDQANAPQVIASMNPCACSAGERKACICSATTLRRYTEQPDTPLLDRFDIFHPLQVTAHPETKEEQKTFFRKIKIVKASITDSGQKQYARYKKGAPRWNGNYQFGDLYNFGNLNTEAWNMLEQSRLNLRLSKRRISGIARVARSIADLDDSDVVTKDHILEAIALRPPKNMRQ